MSHAFSSHANGSALSTEPDLPGVTQPRTASTTLRSAPLRLRFTNRSDWNAGLRHHVLPLDSSVADPQSFQCHAVVSRLRGNPVAEVRVGASRLMRRAADIQQDKGNSGCVQIFWQLAGRSRVRQGPNSATLEAGNWTVCDSGREYAMELDKGTRFVLILVPRSQCPGWLCALNVLAARALRANAPANIAMAALTAMLRDAAPLDRQSEDALHDSIVALMERALAIEMDGQGIGSVVRLSERAIRLPRIQAYILEHLADPGLNVARVASLFGMSRRSLYNLFAPSGVAPYAFIQGARLDRACALLKQPASHNVPVASIARQCGFADPAHFTRAFHTRHGAAPTAWRDKASCRDTLIGAD